MREDLSDGSREEEFPAAEVSPLKRIHDSAMRRSNKNKAQFFEPAH